jgi:UPF0176 protein
MATVRLGQEGILFGGYLLNVPEQPAWTITAFYRFTPFTAEALPKLQSGIAEWMRERGMLGLVVLGAEGINGTVSGTVEAIAGFKVFVQELCGIDGLRFKDSASEIAPFLNISVDIRNEIVTLKRPDLAPAEPENRHLSPSEWHEMLLSPEPKVVVDTRNAYETIAGKFRGAIDPQIENFSDWGAYLDEAELPRDVPVLIYCTGGIRCEKAILEMKERGYDEVFQLRDGILGYLEEYPDGLFEGECFVFDRRVTVGPDLKPTGNFGVCTACGTTTAEKGKCEHCGVAIFSCVECAGKPPVVCSKTCKDRAIHRRRRAA